MFILVHIKKIDLPSSSFLEPRKKKLPIQKNINKYFSIKKNGTNFKKSMSIVINIIIST